MNILTTFKAEKGFWKNDVEVIVIFLSEKVFNSNNVLSCFRSINPKVTIWRRENQGSSFIPEMRDLQRLIKTYNMRYFPQHVLLCTSTVHDQSGDICIQGYLRIR